MFGRRLFRRQLVGVLALALAGPLVLSDIPFVTAADTARMGQSPAPRTPAPQAPEDRAPTEVRVALGVEPTHALVTHGWASYMAAVKAGSGGSIRFQISAGGGSAAARNSLAALRDGIADAAFLQTPAWLGEFPHQRLIGDLAMLGADAVAMTGAISEFMLRHCSDCLREMTAQHVVYTGGLVSGAYYLFTHERLVLPQALRVKKIRTPGKAWNRWAAAFNALPVGIEIGALRDALRNRTLDAAIASIDEARQEALWGVSGHATFYPLGMIYAGAPAAFGHDFWRRLPAADRKILLVEAAHASIDTAVQLDVLDRDALRHVTGLGFTLDQPDPRLVAAHDEFVRADLAVIEREAAAYGIRNAKAKIELMAKLARKWEAIVNETDHDAGKLVDILRREVHSKLDSAKYGS